jgi:hypothetical protein
MQIGSTALPCRVVMRAKPPSATSAEGIVAMNIELRLR